MLIILVLKYDKDKSMMGKFSVFFNYVVLCTHCVGLLHSAYTRPRSCGRLFVLDLPVVP